MERIGDLAQLIKIGDETIAFEGATCCSVDRHHRHVRSRPLPARCKRQFSAITAGQQQASRTLGNIGQRSDHTLAQRSTFGTRLTDRPVEPEPFGAVIVPQLEQVLDHSHPQPAAQPL